MAKLLENTILRLSVPAGERDAYVWDSTLPGFGIRAFASGRKSFIVKYKLPSGQQRKLALGPALPGTLAETRRKAHDILARARLGQDVQGERKAARERASKEKRAGDLIGDYLAMKRTEVRPSSFREIDRHLSRLLQSLHDRPIETIGRRDVVAIIDELARAGKRVQADRCKTSAVGFFNWCIERDYLPANPAAGIKRRVPKEAVERDRVLGMSELATLWRTTTTFTDYDNIIRLLILTGARADEIGCLEWSEIDLSNQEIHLPAERMKNRREHRIFLSCPAIEILQTIAPRPRKKYVFGQTANPFSGWSKCKARLDAKLTEAFQPWRVHDLRRSLATNASDLGLASTVVIEMALGHWSGEKRGIVKTYNRSTHDAERRELMDRWAAALLAAVDEQPGNPIVALAAQ